MTDSDVKVITKFRLDLDPKRAVFTDDIDYGSLGETIANYKGVILISGPRGTIYNNTDFDNPDIDPSVSRNSVNQINLVVDGYTGQVLKSNYTVKYTVKNTVTGTTYSKTYVYSFDFTEPEISIDVDSGPFTATLRSTDTTDYGDDVNTLIREHRIQYPVDILPAPPADIVSTSDSVEVSTIYTNTWVVTITSTVQYIQASDGLRYTWYGTDSAEHCVNGACIDAMYEALDAMFQQYLEYVDTNPSKAQQYRERLVQANMAIDLAEIAWRNDEFEEADQQAATLQEILELVVSVPKCQDGAGSTEVSPCPDWDGGGGVPASYTFTNGLTEAGGTVKLGGTLTQDTSINLDDQFMRYHATDSGKTADLKIAAASGLYMEASDVSLKYSVDMTSGYFKLRYDDLGTPTNSKEYNIEGDGFKEAADYTADYTARSLIAKQYADSNFLSSAAGTLNALATKTTPIDGDVLIIEDSAAGYAQKKILFSSIAGSFLGLTDVDPSDYTGHEGEIVRVNNTPDGLEFYDLSGDFISTADGTISALANKATPAEADVLLVEDSAASYAQKYITVSSLPYAATYLDLTDGPSSYSGSGGKFLAVKGTEDGVEFVTGSGWVPATGGSFTGVVTFVGSDDYMVRIQQSGTGGTPSTPEAGNNYLGFYDGDGDLQGYIGINTSGDIYMKSNVSGGTIYADDDLEVAGSIILSGDVDGIDIAAFYSAYSSHTHSFASITGKPSTLAGYGITDGLDSNAGTWSTNFSLNAAPTTGDFLLIEDNAAGGQKKYVNIGNLPTSATTFISLTDTPGTFSGQGLKMVRVNTGATALEFYDYTNDFIARASGTLNAFSEKASPTVSDIILIEDASASYAQKKVLIGNLPGTGGTGDAIVINARKGSAGTILEGTPVYISGYNASGWVEVEESDASDSGTMPAIGIAAENITSGATADVVIAGRHADIDTSLYSVGDMLYVANGGGLTDSRPASTDIVQRIGIVMRSNDTNGVIDVLGSLENDLPNLAEDYTWVGNGSQVATETEFSFENLIDTSAFYGNSLKYVRVNSGETALEYVDGSSFETWDRSSTDLSPAHAGDDILLSQTEYIKWGDGDTWIVESADDQIGFYTNSSKRFEIQTALISLLETAQYDQDYSAGASDRWLTDKEYVDTVVGSIAFWDRNASPAYVTPLTAGDGIRIDHSAKIEWGGADEYITAVSGDSDMRFYVNGFYSFSIAQEGISIVGDVFGEPTLRFGSSGGPTIQRTATTGTVAFSTTSGTDQKFTFNKSIHISNPGGLYMGSDNLIFAPNGTDVFSFYIGGSPTIDIHSGYIEPTSFYNLGNSSHFFGASYISNMYIGGTDVRLSRPGANKLHINAYSALVGPGEQFSGGLTYEFFVGYNTSSNNTSRIGIIGRNTAANNLVGSMSFHQVYSNSETYDRIAEIQGYTGASVDDGQLWFRTVYAGSLNNNSNSSYMDERGRLFVSSSQNAPLNAIRTTTVASSKFGAQKLSLQTTIASASGLGPRQYFSYSDDTYTDVNLAIVGAWRGSSYNEGHLGFYTYDGASTNLQMEITAIGQTVIGSVESEFLSQHFRTFIYGWEDGSNGLSGGLRIFSGGYPAYGVYIETAFNPDDFDTISETSGQEAYGIRIHMHPTRNTEYGIHLVQDGGGGESPLRTGIYLSTSGFVENRALQIAAGDIYFDELASDPGQTNFVTIDYNGKLTSVQDPFGAGGDVVITPQYAHAIPYRSDSTYDRFYTSNHFLYYSNYGMLKMSLHSKESVETSPTIALSTSYNAYPLFMHYELNYTGSDPDAYYYFSHGLYAYQNIMEGSYPEQVFLMGWRYDNFYGSPYQLNPEELVLVARRESYDGIYLIGIGGDASDDARVTISDASYGAGTHVLQIRMEPFANNKRFIQFTDIDVGADTQAGAIYFNGSGITYGNTSDRRQKDNIVPTVIDPVQILNDLEIVDFTTKKGDGTVGTGYIAQDAFKIYSRMAHYHDESDTWTIDQMALIPVLNKAFQEHWKQTQSHEERIKSLEDENATLRDQVFSLRGELNSLKN